MRRRSATVLAAAAILTALAGMAAVFAQTQPPGRRSPGEMMPRGEGGMMGGGRMGQREMANLKALPPERTVQGVKYCKGQYFVSTAAGDVLEFSEFNLRIKTDFSDKGPAQGKPALLPAAMMGDRAFLVFSDPAEISRYIEKACEGN
jgi:cytochrome c